MSPAHSPIVLWSLLGYVVWTMLLVVFILLARGGVIARGEKKFNEFPGGVPHGSDGYWRLYRAHANVVENLPLIVPVFALFYAFARPTPLVAWLPAVALGGRLVQSLAHIASGSVPAVAARFTGLLVQYACLVFMIVAIARVLPQS
jgi:uncharacterized membrane protein YecN with MAPEG domain